MKSNEEKFAELEAAKIKWPFSTMEVGDVVQLDKAEYPRAQAYAHTYAQLTGRAVSTMTDKATGIVYVKRIK